MNSKLSPKRTPDLWESSEKPPTMSVQKAREAGFANPRLIVTILRKSGSTSTVAVGDVAVTFEPDDQCYPISQDEWDLFQGDEPNYCRTPMMVWAVDRAKYTTPI